MRHGPEHVGSFQPHQLFQQLVDAGREPKLSSYDYDYKYIYVLSNERLRQNIMEFQ